MNREELITAYLDGELGEAEQLRVEAELDARPEMRHLHDELLATRGRLRAFFDEESAAPKSPTFSTSITSSNSRPGAWVRHRFALLGSAAAVLLAVTAVFLWDNRHVEAAADQVMERAAQNYLESGEAELWLRFDLPANTALEKLLQSWSAKGHPLGKHRAMKIRLAEGNRFLAMPTSDPAEDWRMREGLTGFDGQRFWRVARRDGAEVLVVKNLDEVPLDEEGRDRFERMHWAQLLSWDFVRELGSERVILTEATWPADRRGGRRVFDLRPRPAAEGRKSEARPLRWQRARVTVDPQRDRIERVELEVSFFGMATLRVTADVVETGAAIDEELFRAERHVPASLPLLSESRHDSGN
jgi:hypothetical protein